VLKPGRRVGQVACFRFREETEFENLMGRTVTGPGVDFIKLFFSSFIKMSYYVPEVLTANMYMITI
jgi:hypothetical protein